MHDLFFFFFTDSATPKIYTLSLHDALPISKIDSLPAAKPSALRWSTKFSPARNTPITGPTDRKSTRLNSSHGYISYAVFCLKKKKIKTYTKDDENDTDHRRQTHDEL